MDLKLSGIGKTYKDKTILDNISFDVGPKELVSIVGPSGVGKTTLLNIIAGLDSPCQGQVTFVPEPSRSRPVIMVFQDYVLFPSMTVRDNIGFGLKTRKTAKPLIREKVDQMLEYFYLTGHGSHFPAQLSAGQKQRVAIARAMIVNPAVLLLDEPFANLDRNLKMETAGFIRRTQKEFGIPTISVTHDLSEALAMSDRIGVLLKGRLRQYDTPKNVYFAPVSRDVARFMGPVNIIPRDMFPLFSATGNQGDKEILARPENLVMEPQHNGPGRVREKTFAGHYLAYMVEMDTRIFTVYCQDHEFSPGQHVSLTLKPFLNTETP